MTGVICRYALGVGSGISRDHNASRDIAREEDSAEDETPVEYEETDQERMDREAYVSHVVTVIFDNVVQANIERYDSVHAFIEANATEIKRYHRSRIWASNPSSTFSTACFPVVPFGSPT